jgi:hypothetical protein
MPTFSQSGHCSFSGSNCLIGVSQLPKAQQFVSDLLRLPLAVGHVGTFNDLLEKRPWARP